MLLDLLKSSYKVLVSGDSISKGVVYSEEKCKYTILEDNYVALVQDKLKGIVVNISKFGSTITKGVNILQNEFVKHTPDIVLIEYGGNDCDFNWEEIAKNPEGEHFPRTDFSTFEKLLDETVNFLKTNKIIPVLMTLPPLNADWYLKWISKNNPSTENNILKWLGSATKIYWWQERYNSIIVNIAEETRTRWIDVRGAFLHYPDFTKFICRDGIHPNKTGHKIIANKIIDYIKAHHSYMLSES